MRVALSSIVLVACTAHDDELALRFTADPGATGGERYQCFGFSIGALSNRDIASIRFVQADSPVLLHHISLFASPSPFPDGPVDCLAMPEDAIPMNVWAPGGGDVALADDTSLVVPESTSRLIVQTHALRMADGPAIEREIVIVPRNPALHRAGWLPLRGPVPVIQPHTRNESTSTCTLDAPLHVVSTWPHMHQIGAEFHGLVEVVPWVFDAQHAYAVDIELAAGESITTQCIWENSTDAPVLPGPRITDEMCGQSLMAYPAEAARCR
jgi:hypothetical protein